MSPVDSSTVEETSLTPDVQWWQSAVIYQVYPRSFADGDGGTWRVEAGNLLICERSVDFFVAVAMGTEPVRLLAGSVLLSAEPLAEDGW